jgi:hypothetical protein
MAKNTTPKLPSALSQGLIEKQKEQISSSVKNVIQPVESQDNLQQSINEVLNNPEENLDQKEEQSQEQVEDNEEDTQGVVEVRTPRRPDRYLPHQEKQYAQVKDAPNTGRKNELGLEAVSEDDCFNLNKKWKHGCCVVDGNRPCSFLGGKQKLCDLYVSKEDVKIRNRYGARL